MERHSSTFAFESLVFNMFMFTGNFCLQVVANVDAYNQFLTSCRIRSIRHRRECLSQQ